MVRTVLENNLFVMSQRALVNTSRFVQTPMSHLLQRPLLLPLSHCCLSKSEGFFLLKFRSLITESKDKQIKIQNSIQKRLLKKYFYLVRLTLPAGINNLPARSEIRSQKSKKANLTTFSIPLLGKHELEFLVSVNYKSFLLVVDQVILELKY